MKDKAEFEITKVPKPDPSTALGMGGTPTPPNEDYVGRTFQVDCTVPVTEQMLLAVLDVRGIARVGGDVVDRYRFAYLVGKLFDPDVVEGSVRESLINYSSTLDENGLPWEEGEDPVEECEICEKYKGREPTIVTILRHHGYRFDGPLKGP